MILPASASLPADRPWWSDQARTFRARPRALGGGSSICC